MTDKVQKIREEIEKLHKEYRNKKGALYYRKALRTVLFLIDTLQKEPKPKFKVGDRIKFKGIHNEDVTRVITNIQKGDGNGFRYFLADGSIHSIVGDEIELVEEPVSEDMWEASKQYALRQVLASTDTEMSEQAYLELRLFSGFELAVAHKDGARWKEEQLEKNHLKHCNSITNEQAELEQGFVDKHLDKHQRMPTFLDAIEYGMNLQKEQMMKDAFEFTKEHNTACVLASECLRGNGWFSKERDFNDLFRHLSCVDKLFEGKFSGNTKVIVIKED